MENTSNDQITIPGTYNEILEFIVENKTLIVRDFKLILKIYSVLDSLLKNAKNMRDLHKDTQIILETIKLQLDSFVKQFKNEISLSKMIMLIETDEMDDFFGYIEANSQALQLIDRLNFNYKAKEFINTKKRTTRYNEEEEKSNEPDDVESIKAQNEYTLDIQEIKNRVMDEKSIEFFNLIFDSESFSKTVKNAFNLALALRMKHISVVMEDSKLVVIPYSFMTGVMDHSIFEMTPKQYENLKKKMKQ